MARRTVRLLQLSSGWDGSVAAGGAVRGPRLHRSHPSEVAVTRAKQTRGADPIGNSVPVLARGSVTGQSPCGVAARVLARLHHITRLRELDQRIADRPGRTPQHLRQLGRRYLARMNPQTLDNQISQLAPH